MGFELLIVAAILGVSLWQLRQSQRLVGTVMKKASRLFALLNLFTFLLVLVAMSLDILSVKGDLLLLSSAMMIFYNGGFAFWAKKYFPRFGPAFGSGKDDSKRKELCRAFGITPRELEVIGLICEGKSNREIAEALFISEQTVKDHNHNIFRKTGVSNRVQLVNLVHRR